ncbi:hypothetical protein NQ317_009441, partial [Molorchus minor]
DLNENGSLVVLEHLMEEFFNPLTNNVRKHEIELQLHSFKRMPQLWKFCIYFITNTSSQHVTMFALSTLESVINQQWSTTDLSGKEVIKNVLHNTLIEKGASAPHIFRNKYAKLLVDVAKQEWPERYPNFFFNILELLKSECSQLIGLILLRTTSEEFMGLHSTFEGGRKQEITRLLQQYIPVVFELLTNILENLSAKPRHTSTATPPPSPTHPTSTPNFSHQLATATFRPDSKALNKKLSILSNIFSRGFLHFLQKLDDDDMCVLAMSTINELLYRKSTPPESQDFFIQLYHHLVELLKDVTSSSNYKMDTLDPATPFVETGDRTELLGFGILIAFFQLTMQLPSAQCYLRCLSVWATFIKQIKPQNAHKYSEVFAGLSTALLKKIQFTCNYNQLNQVNDTDIEENLSPWKMSHDVYRHMELAVDHQNHTLNFDISETERLCYVLKDFSSLTQTLTRLSSLFIDQESQDVSRSATNLINCLIEKLLESASLAISARFYQLKLRESRLTECFIDIHGELLAALKTWLVWMTQKEKMSDHHTRIIIDITLPVLLEAFAPNVIVLPMVVQFIHVAPNLNIADPETKCVLNSSISNLLLKPWGDLSNSDAAQRNLLIGAFFENLTREFRELTPTTSEGKVLEVAQRILPSLSNIVEHCKNFPLASKRLLFAVIKPTIEHTLLLLPNYVTFNEISNHMLTFFLNVLGVFQQQLGVEGTKSAVDVFLQVAVRILRKFILVNKINYCYSEQQASNLAGLDKLLQILQLVVESPGNAYKTFLPGILQLCMENVYPLVAGQAGDAPDVFLALLTLLYSILLNRWQYFYISQVRLGYSPGCSESEIGPDRPQKPEQLLAVLQVFGQALLQHDISIFRLSLAALEDINSKWRLYHKALFRDHLLPQFLTVLLNCLIEKSQSLLSEDIETAIYNMAAVNFDGFFSTFLRRFIQNINELTQSQWEILMDNFIHNHDRDIPTFVHHLRRFISDIQHFKMCNIGSNIVN